jgi:hypothetical protein
MTRPIHTLDARNHILLSVLREHFGLSTQSLRREIQRLHRDLIAILESKSIEYDALRSALVPSMDRQEAAFIFDSTAFESGLYGRETFNYILPLLEPKSTQSILHGDLLGDDQQLIFEILRESMTLSRSLLFKHATLLYAVYINNLSDAAMKRLHDGLATCPAYIGHIPTTFSSRAKTYLSTTVGSFVLKKGKTLIVAHEGDRPNHENINITFYPLEEFGYKVASLQSDYFAMFLAFKIERPTFKGFESDTEFGLNAISDDVSLFESFTVLLEEAKHGYLINEKLGKLRQAGLANADRDQIANLIQSKLSANYIYNLTYLEEHDVAKFNIMLEVPHSTGYPTRLTAALEYLPEKQVLRVITLH